MTKPLVIFDLDGTLIDSASWLLRAVNQVLEPYVSRAWTVDDLVATAGGAEHAVFARIVPPEALNQVLAAYAKALAEPGTLRPQTGIPSLLDTIERDGFPLALFSGAGRRLGEMRLAHMGWLDRFPVRVWGDAVAAKPSPEGIQRVLEQTGTPAASAVYVGDVHKDALAARAAGCHFIGVAWGDVPGGPEAGACATPLELRERIRSLFP